MMTKSKYVHSIALSQEEEILIQALRQEGITMAKIFRDGLAIHAPKVPKALLDKVKNLVK